MSDLAPVMIMFVMLVIIGLVVFAVTDLKKGNDSWLREKFPDAFPPVDEETPTAEVSGSTATPASTGTPEPADTRTTTPEPTGTRTTTPEPTGTPAPMSCLEFTVTNAVWNTTNFVSKLTLSTSPQSSFKGRKVYQKLSNGTCISGTIVGVQPLNSQIAVDTNAGWQPGMIRICSSGLGDCSGLTPVTTAAPVTKTCVSLMLTGTADQPGATVPRTKLAFNGGGLQATWDDQGWIASQVGGASATVIGVQPAASPPAAFVAIGQTWVPNTEVRFCPP